MNCMSSCMIFSNYALSYIVNYKNNWYSLQRNNLLSVTEHVYERDVMGLQQEKGDIEIDVKYNNNWYIFVEYIVVH